MKRYKATGVSLPIEVIKIIDSERGDISRSRYVLRKLEDVYGKKFLNSLDSGFASLQSSEFVEPKGDAS